RAPTGDAIRATRAARRPQHLRFDLRAEQTRPVVCRAGHIHWRELASGRSSRHDGPVMTLIAALPDSDDPTAVFDAFSGWVADQGITLYPHQEEALIEIVSGSNVILNTPTGSGKSLVATGAHFAAIATDRVSFYTAPIKALVSEKFFALCEIFGARNVGMLTGDAA